VILVRKEQDRLPRSRILLRRLNTTIFCRRKRGISFGAGGEPYSKVQGVDASGGNDTQGKR